MFFSSSLFVHEILSNFPERRHSRECIPLALVWPEKYLMNAVFYAADAVETGTRPRQRDTSSVFCLRRIFFPAGTENWKIGYVGCWDHFSCRPNTHRHISVSRQPENVRLSNQSSSFHCCKEPSPINRQETTDTHRHIIEPQLEEKTQVTSLPFSWGKKRKKSRLTGFLVFWYSVCVCYMMGSVTLTWRLVKLSLSSPSSSALIFFQSLLHRRSPTRRGWRRKLGKNNLKRVDRRTPGKNCCNWLFTKGGFLRKKTTKWSMLLRAIQFTLQIHSIVSTILYS